MMKETIISFPDIAMGFSMPPLLVVKGEDAAKGYSSNSGSRLSQARTDAAFESRDFLRHCIVCGVGKAGVKVSIVF